MRNCYKEVTKILENEGYTRIGQPLKSAVELDSSVAEHVAPEGSQVHGNQSQCESLGIRLSVSP